MLLIIIEIIFCIMKLSKTSAVSVYGPFVHGQRATCQLTHIPSQLFAHTLKQINRDNNLTVFGVNDISNAYIFTKSQTVIEWRYHVSSPIIRQ